MNEYQLAAFKAEPIMLNPPSADCRMLLVMMLEHPKDTEFDLMSMGKKIHLPAVVLDWAIRELKASQYIVGRDDSHRISDGYWKKLEDRYGTLSNRVDLAGGDRNPADADAGPEEAGGRNQNRKGRRSVGGGGKGAGAPADPA